MAPVAPAGRRRGLGASGARPKFGWTPAVDVWARILLAFALATSCRPATCTPGQQSPCACTDGAPGAQLCDSTGRRFLPCTCAGPATAAATPSGPALAAAGNDGTDPRRPTLAPADADFVDKRGGWGWNDRCYINLKQGKLGWAKAECEAAMRMTPASPMPMASVLYNLGLVEQAAGDAVAARTYFERSLALREHPEVRAALDAAAGRAAAPAKQIACGTKTCSVVCCASFGDLSCASSPNDCPRADNGEGTLYECDGPEDCAGGKVCCLIPMDRTTAAACRTATECKGALVHPRYGDRIPLLVVCHTDAECGSGLSCQREDAKSVLSVCK